MDKNTNIFILHKPPITTFHRPISRFCFTDLLIGEKDGEYTKLVLFPYIVPIKIKGPGDYHIKICKSKEEQDNCCYLDIKVL